MTLPHKRIFFIISIAMLTGCSLREINLTDHNDTSNIDASYLLVNKSENINGESVYVRAINNIELDINIDPCVYAFTSGANTISYSTTSDFVPYGEGKRHTLSIHAVPGKYYQLRPDTNGSHSVTFSELEKTKIKAAHNKQPSLLRFILFFKG